MGYRMPQQPYPGPMYVMGPAGAVASLSNRLPQPVSTVGSEPNFAGGVAAAKVSAAAAGDASSQASMAASSTGTSKSKQGLEKILDTLSKMFPDVRRSVTTVLR